MKVTILCDYYFSVEMAKEVYLPVAEKLGMEFKIYHDDDVKTADQTGAMMLETEQNGTERVVPSQGLLDAVADAEGIIVHLLPVGSKLIDAAPNLKFIGALRGGMESVYVDYAENKGIKVMNAPWRSADGVADFTVGMMVAEMKNIARAHREMMEGRFTKLYVNSNNIHNFNRQTVGIIGMGYIGTQVAKRLSGFGCKLIAYDPMVEDDVIRERGCEPVDKETLLKTADVVTIHLKLVEATHHFMGKEEFAMMKPTAMYINTARAGLHDEDALIEVLKEHKIKGAAIDVYYEEPLPEDNPYRKLDNVTLTPHIAGPSEDTFLSAAEIIRDQLLDLYAK